MRKKRLLSTVNSKFCMKNNQTFLKWSFPHLFFNARNHETRHWYTNDVEFSRFVLLAYFITYVHNLARCCPSLILIIITLPISPALHISAKEYAPFDFSLKYSSIYADSNPVVRFNASAIIIIADLIIHPQPLSSPIPGIFFLYENQIVF